MNENLYNFYVSKLVMFSRMNPIYQYPMLVFFNQGILWDIEKYKKSELFSNLSDKPFSRREKRIHIGVGRRNMIVEAKEPYLRKVNYFSTLAPLLHFFPELTPALTQN